MDPAGLTSLKGVSQAEEVLLPPEEHREAHHERQNKRVYDEAKRANYIPHRRPTHTKDADADSSDCGEPAEDQGQRGAGLSSPNREAGSDEDACAANQSQHHCRGEGYAAQDSDDVSLLPVVPLINGWAMRA
jgi:hypothetical protein